MAWGWGRRRGWGGGRGSSRREREEEKKRFPTHEFNMVVAHVKRGDEKAVKKILKKKGRATWVTMTQHQESGLDLSNGECLLHVAAAASSMPIPLFSYLYKKAEDKNPRDARRKTLLHHACEQGTTRLVKWLLGKKECVVQGDATGSSALHYLCSRDDVALVKQVLNSSRVDINAKDQDGLSPLHLSMLTPAHGTFDFLLSSARQSAMFAQRGVDVDSRAHDGHTPLSLSVSLGNVTMCKQLLCAGATVDHISWGGDTAAQVAAREGQLEILTTLVRCGANVERRDSTGITIRQRMSAKPAIRDAVRFSGRPEVVSAVPTSAKRKRSVSDVSTASYHVTPLPTSQRTNAKRMRTSTKASTQRPAFDLD